MFIYFNLLELRVGLCSFSGLTGCVCFRDVKRVLFVPYALHDRDAYTKTARDKFRTLGGSDRCCVLFFQMFCAFLN